MAKKASGEGLSVAPSDVKYKPRAHVSWPAEGIRMSGDHGKLAMGKRATVQVSGTVKGYSMHDHGCSVDMDCDTIQVSDVSDSKGPAGTPMADMIGRKRRG